jgi:YidC/Oxa1 family membrane protein insertase
VLGAILYLNYQAWIHDYGAPPKPQATISAPDAGSAQTPLGRSIPRASPAPAAESPAASSAAKPEESQGETPSGMGAATNQSAMLHVKTDVLDLEINLSGGEIDRADLSQYPQHKDTPNVPMRLESSDPAVLYVLQTGLADPAGDEDAPTHLATFSSEHSSYALADAAKELKVPLTWTDGRGLKVTKTFVFTRGTYAIGLEYAVENGTGEPKRLRSYSRILRHWDHPSRSYFDVETYSFKGPAVWATKYRDLNVESDTDSKFNESVTNGWLASLQHHFVSAIVPPAGQAYDYNLQVQDHEYLLSASGPTQEIAPGASANFHEKLYIGPKLQAQLAETAPNLQRTVDYGRLWFIAEPLFAALSWIHGVVGNWGWTIIIVTALIKLIFYPLSQASGRSMAKMRSVGPRMKQIQETFKDDKEKLGRAMMELYKKEKINPLAGCLPMIVQIPVFISFYWVLLESVEMRQAPFLLWINDLSSRDPYFVLPLLMGGAMFGQFKLNPAPPDPMQAKVMQFMPLVMTGMMAWFPSGLVLYWLTNTVLSIAQQWRINQVVQGETPKR